MAVAGTRLNIRLKVGWLGAGWRPVAGVATHPQHPTLGLGEAPGEGREILLAARSAGEIGGGGDPQQSVEQIHLF